MGEPVGDIGGSPNHDSRGGRHVDMVLLHYTVLAAREALELLSDPVGMLPAPGRTGGPVSCHWLIERDGTTHALVDEGRRAWHAGASRWGTARELNATSIGIELENDGVSDYPEPQIAGLETLLAAIMRRHAVRPERVLGHSCVSIGRKHDPGPRFPWARLAASELAVWPTEAGLADPAALPAALDRIGFDPSADPAARLRAFRLRFRPGVDGPADSVDAGIAAAVAFHWPVRTDIDPAVAAE